jgi:methionine--tRNA ligase beta chain
MTDPKRYLITSALPYANGPKHIGHLAGAYLPADVYVRYLRAQKRDVVYVCGSDEHGAAITIQAMKEKTTPKAIVDKYHAMLKSNMADLGISFDIYHRTSEQIHHETAQEFFTMLNDNGDLEIKETEQFFDVEANTFLADRYIIGTCPVCANDSAYGDQCEKCGTDLSPEQLINPRSTLSGNAPIKKATTHWYLPLNKHEDFLRKWILEEHKEDWKANVVGQCKGWIEMGLQPRAVTRDLDWGIKVPAPLNPPTGGTLESESDDGSFKYNLADPMIYSLLKQFVAEHRSNPTEAENFMWQILRGKKIGGFKFRRQHIIGSYIADFVCLSQQIVIEIDGLIHQVPENILSDEARTLELNRLGFDVIRFTNDEVFNDTDNVIKKITYELTKKSLKVLESKASAVQELRDSVNVEEKNLKVLESKVPAVQELRDSANVEEKNLKVLESKVPPVEGFREAGKVLYVWFDAPIGYISATKQWALDNKKDWRPYWYNSESEKGDTKLVHFIGKDNIVFHAIIFPVMLKLHGNILPDNVPSNEFMNLEGDKMSTSRGWSIEMDDYINDFVKKENGGDQMVDALRYYLTAIAPETKDSEFTWKGFQDAVNGELVAVFGNFVNRAFVLMHKLCGGKVPKFHNDIIDEADKQLLEEIKNTKALLEKNIEGYKFRDAQTAVIDLARKGNKYMQDKEPWIIAKQTTDDGQLTTEAQALVDNCMHICLQLVANLAIFINPFLPNAAKRMCTMMKTVDKMLDWENAGSTKLLSVGYSLRPPELLFRKIEDTEVAEQIEKLKIKSARMKTTDDGQEAVGNGQLAIGKEQASVESTKSEMKNLKSEIQFDDFAKIDLKVGTIVSAEKVEKADKLLKLEVDLGFEVTTIVSGIALHFEPATIVGKQVVVVANLAPRKMRGIESNGMILMAEDATGKLHFVAPSDVVGNGSGVS